MKLRLLNSVQNPLTKRMGYSTSSSKHSTSGLVSKYQPKYDAQSVMYKNQSNLPSLPVPSLQETADRFYKTALPLFKSEKEKQDTEKALKEFLSSSQVKELQRRLEQRAIETKQHKKSWLIDWWNSLAYMAYRDSVVINVSYFFQFMDDPWRKGQTERAAALVEKALEFRQEVIDQKLEPDTAGRQKDPLCMEQYKYMFNSCRIPLTPEDEVSIYDPVKNQHIAVVRKGKFYVFSVVDPKTGGYLSCDEIKVQLDKIKEMADSDGFTSMPLGLLTTENRDTWTKARDTLFNYSIGNQESFRKLDSAIMLLCLDDTSPVSRDEVGRELWHSDGRNRYFDKTLQVIVFENGKAGFNGEHSMMDATPTTRFCDYICEHTLNNPPKPNATTKRESAVSIEPLLFQYPEAFSGYVANAAHRLQADIDKHDHRVLAYLKFGKNKLKNFKVSPDAFVQMSIQLAFYKMFGECRGTYESAQTKKYHWGRTETCRSVSVESMEFVKAFSDASVPANKRVELARKAIAEQSKYMANSVNGYGVDRHFLGLKKCLKPGEQMPSLFNDPVFQRSCHWNLSTSQIGSEYFDGYGWGEVVNDGFGVAYLVHNDSIRYNVACQHGGKGWDYGPGSWRGVGKGISNSAQKFCSYLEQSLNEMEAAFEKDLAMSQTKSKL